MLVGIPTALLSHSCAKTFDVGLGPARQVARFAVALTAAWAVCMTTAVSCAVANQSSTDYDYRHYYKSAQGVSTTVGIIIVAGAVVLLVGLVWFVRKMIRWNPS
jgi:ABC-type Co2+ transport system permease subunit